MSTGKVSELANADSIQPRCGNDPEHAWRVWRMGGADGAGSPAAVVPPADVHQRGCVAAGGAGALPGIADGARRRGHAGADGAASTGVRRPRHRAPAVAAPVRTSDGG